ncbi:hypothetical protein ACFYWX_03105 [Streptomyces sp. NPDC002888]|uniref:hypothetical protein n=1 Tax=Streptomyces sp. NPDC002888 TaxID=3364668 RepID=UPI00367AF3E7
MTPWRRALCVVGAGFLLLQGGASAYGGVSYGSVSSYDTPSASPSAPDRAGSRAGVGKVRPGRSDEEREGEEEGEGEDDESESAESGVDDEEPTPATEPPGEAGLVPSKTPGAGSTEEQPVGRVLRILPLGSGLVLIGLGLGLAFLALRLRRV